MSKTSLDLLDALRNRTEESSQETFSELVGERIVSAIERRSEEIARDLFGGSSLEEGFVSAAASTAASGMNNAAARIGIIKNRLGNLVGKAIDSVDSVKIKTKLGSAELNRDKLAVDTPVGSGEIDFKKNDKKTLQKSGSSLPVKEETESLDELSKKTLGSYVKKASAKLNTEETEQIEELSLQAIQKLGIHHKHQAVMAKRRWDAEEHEEHKKKHDRAKKLVDAKLAQMRHERDPSDPDHKMDFWKHILKSRSMRKE